MKLSPVVSPPREAVAAKYNVIFMGDAGVGKSSLVRNICRRPQMNDQQLKAAVLSTLNTVGIDFERFQFQSRTTNQKYEFQLWDTAGQERFESLVPSYARNAQILFVVFSFDNERSFHNVAKWIELFRRHVTNSKAVIFMVGNKTDLWQKDGQITSAMIRKMKLDCKIDEYFESCALEAKVPVTDIFESAAQWAQTRHLIDDSKFLSSASILVLDKPNLKTDKAESLSTTTMSCHC